MSIRRRKMPAEGRKSRVGAPIVGKASEDRIRDYTSLTLTYRSESTVLVEAQRGWGDRRWRFQVLSVEYRRLTLICNVGSVSFNTTETSKASNAPSLSSSHSPPTSTTALHPSPRSEQNVPSSQSIGSVVFPHPKGSSSLLQVRGTQVDAVGEQNWKGRQSEEESSVRGLRRSAAGEQGCCAKVARGDRSATRVMETSMAEEEEVREGRKEETIGCVRNATDVLSRSFNSFRRTRANGDKERGRYRNVALQGFAEEEKWEKRCRRLELVPLSCSILRDGRPHLRSRTKTTSEM